MIKFETSDGIEELRRDHGGDLVSAAFEIVAGFLFEEICICFDTSTSNLVIH